MMFLLSAQIFHLESFLYAWSTLLRISRGGEFLKLLSEKNLKNIFPKLAVISYSLLNTTLWKSPLWAYYSFKSNKAMSSLSGCFWDFYWVFQIFRWVSFRNSWNFSVIFFKYCFYLILFSSLLELQLLICYMLSFCHLLFTLLFFIFLHAEFWIIPSYFLFNHSFLSHI